MVELTTLVDTSVLVGVQGAADVQLDGGWAVSAVAVGELDAGVLLATDPAVRAARLRRLTAVLAVAPVLDVDRAVAARFGELRAAAHRAATNDLWIAATALAHDLTLLTGDMRQAALPLVRTQLLPAG
jgi:predicted nucleic acid-binding protein